MENPLSISELVKDYGSLRAVDKVSFQIHPGEIFGLLGPNGAGKTSIISSIVGLSPRTSGEIQIFGKDPLTHPRETKSVVGFVPQEIINHGYFNISEIIKFYSGYFGHRLSQDYIDNLLRKLGLWDKRYTKVKKLSGGMKRRLLIVKALAHNPKLVLLDEPTAGVDVELRAQTLEVIRDLKKEGKSILLTTHYLNEAELLCDRIGVLNNGKLLMVGETKSLIKSLTYREVQFKLRKPNPDFVHPKLLKNEGEYLTFRIPYSMNVGDLLSEVKWDIKNITDIQIREGDLQQAFLKLMEDSRENKNKETRKAALS